MLGRVRFVYFSFQIVARSRCAEPNRARVFFRLNLNFFYFFRENAMAKHQKPRRQRVERACVTDFEFFLAEPFAKLKTEAIDDIERCPAERFVHQNDAADGKWVWKRLVGREDFEHENGLWKWV